MLSLKEAVRSYSNSKEGKITMKKKRILAFLITILIMALPLQVYAAKPGPVKTTVVSYVSLGDSIAHGMSATPGNSYYDLFSTYLSANVPSKYSYTTVNKGVSGWKTGDLLNSVTSRTGEAGIALKGGTIVTVCIGANNLLGPVINAVANAYGLDSSNPDFLTTLQGKITANPAQWDMVLYQLYFSALAGSLHQDLYKGVASFNADWPLIINGIKKKAPGAQILALTIYDPLPMDNQFYNILNPLIVSINKTINSQAVKSGYKVADIYTDFKLSTESPVSFDMNGNFDPHPNNLGHGIIFEDLKTKVILPR